GAMWTSAPAGSSSKTASAIPCSPKLATRLSADGCPEVETMLFSVPLVVTSPTSIGRDEFDLQVVDARLREIDDAQDPFVVQAVVGRDEQHAPLRGPAAQD